MMTEAPDSSDQTNLSEALEEKDESVLTPALVSDPAFPARMMRKDGQGHYLVRSEALVQYLRQADAAGDEAHVQILLEVLTLRYTKTFQFRAERSGLPYTLHEDVMEAMFLQLIQEVRDPKESFLVKNFPYWLKCMCSDVIVRMRRQEGFTGRTMGTQAVKGRPAHVPQNQRLPLELSGSEDITVQVEDRAAQDEFAQLEGTLDAATLLAHLQDDTDKLVVILRVLEDRQWDDISSCCQISERTARYRYRKSLDILRTVSVSTHP